MGAQSFESAQAKSDHQAERELQVALRVQGMTLVTNNEADFAIYPGLALETWVGQH